jgi:hypothetical protein
MKTIISNGLSHWDGNSRDLWGIAIGGARRLTVNAAPPSSDRTSIASSWATEIMTTTEVCRDYAGAIQMEMPPAHETPVNFRSGFDQRRR